MFGTAAERRKRFPVKSPFLLLAVLGFTLTSSSEAVVKIFFGGGFLRAFFPDL